MNPIVDKIVRYRPSGRVPVAAPRPVAPQVQGRPQSRPGVLDALIGFVWSILLIVGVPGRFILACWTFVELIRWAFGHPGWHFGAYFALLTFWYWFNGVYVPRHMR